MKQSQRGIVAYLIYLIIVASLSLLEKIFNIGMDVNFITNHSIFGALVWLINSLTEK
jgi:hypothetical protein